MKLTTPLGELFITIDDVLIDYDYRTVEKDSTCQDVDGRFAIIVTFVPDGKEHTIACRIKSHHPSIDDDVDTGEYLELKNFYNGTAKLSLGMTGDSGFSTFDYENLYLDDGVAYLILPNTKTTNYVFGISWLNNSAEENEVQTWFGADPMCMRLRVQET